MDPDQITADDVYEALRNVRHARPLANSPLLRLGALRLRLKHEGRTDSPQAREAQLGPYLAEVVWEHLGRLRGADGSIDTVQLTPERELELAARDFDAGSRELESWSAVYLRYFSASRLPLRDVAERLGVSRKTLRRRAQDGHRLLAEALRQREATEVVAAQHNLPHPLTRFIGREREIGEVRAILAEHRLVTLTGAGGIGKSRLAVEVARALAEEYADGVWLAELGAVEDGPQVVSTMASVFDVREQPRRPLVDTLTDYFEAKDLLLLMDNCEHLVDACGELVLTLLGRCANVQVLATSRERLQVAGEATWTVPPLTVPEPGSAPRPARLKHYDAVRLFTDRSGAARPGFELTEENAPHVAEVCTALDGIPLAMELAASRLKVLSVEELAGRLGGRFELLHDGRRPLRPHHETLWSTMDWSHALLDTKEQLLFRRLSVFRGGWTLDAAEAVGAGDGLEEGEIVHVLEQLVDKSVVEVRGTAGERRYRMLQTLRQFAGEKLDESGEAEAVRDRHLDCFLALAEEAAPELAGPDQADWLDRLGTEHTNLRTALRWTVESLDAARALRLGRALTRYWDRRCHWDEGLEHLARLPALPGADDLTAHRAAALNSQGLMYLERDLDAARESFEESLAIRRQLGDRKHIAHSLNNLGIVAFKLEDNQEAWGMWQESLSAFRALGDEQDAARSLHNLANVAKSRQDRVAEGELREEALALSRKLGDQYSIALSLNHLGGLAVIRGDYETALANQEEALAIFRALGERSGVARCLRSLGFLAKEQGDRETARGLEEESLEIWRQLGHQVGIASTLHNLGDLARLEGDHQAARALHAESLTIYSQQGAKQPIGQSLVSFGLLAVAQGRTRRAVRLFGAIEAYFEATEASLPPPEGLLIDGMVETARTALGPTAYDAAYAEGRALTLDEAVAYALGEVTWDELADEVAARVAEGDGAGEGEASEGARPRQ